MIILIRLIGDTNPCFFESVVINNHFQQYYEVKNYFLEIYPSQMKV